MKKLKLTKGRFAIVDDDDFDFLSQWKWSFNDLGYAVRFKYIGRVQGKPKYSPIYLHRVINNTPDGFETDHINRDSLDNRKENLRRATKSQNGRNKYADKRNTSGIRGVSFYSRTQKWRVRISVDKKELSFGYYENLEEARMVAEELQRFYFNK